MILGGGFTQTHQDGHGTVDSGHSNLSGYNEVVMLQRLPGCHKLNACALIPQLGDDCKPTNQAMNMLYQLPHADGQKDRPQRLTTETIKSLENLKYVHDVVVVEECFYFHVFDLVEISIIFVDQIPQSSS